MYQPLPNGTAPSPPFASQMPPPPRGEANPASPSCRHSDGLAVGARTHEGEFRECAAPFFWGGAYPFRLTYRVFRVPPHPHLAGTQTALPSVPVPTKVSFAAVPAPFLDSKTFFRGKKVLARFLCPFLCACKEREEKTPFRFLLLSCLIIKRRQTPTAKNTHPRNKKSPTPVDKFRLL